MTPEVDERVETVITIMTTDTSDGDIEYLSSAYQRADRYGLYDKSNGWGVHTSPEVEDIHDLTDVSREDRFAILQTLQEQLGDDYELKFISLEKIIRITDLEVNDDDLKEFRQMKALEKLTNQEIQVLGLLPIQIYIKTKYHNA